MMNEKIRSRLLVLGANGMLGNTVLRWFDQCSNHEVFGSVRALSGASGLQAQLKRYCSRSAAERAGPGRRVST